MANIAHPLTLDYEIWANQLRQTLINYNIPVVRPIHEWRDWANQIVNSNQIDNMPIATEIGYPTNEHWRDWAIRFYAIIQFQTN
jgi:hypothetical protein